MVGSALLVEGTALEMVGVKKVKKRKGAVVLEAAEDVPPAAPQARAYGKLFDDRIPRLVEMVDDLDKTDRLQAHRVCGILRRALCALLGLPLDSRKGHKLDRLLLMAAVKGAGDELKADGGDAEQVWLTYLHVINLIRPSLFHHLDETQVAEWQSAREGPKRRVMVPVNRVLARAAALFGGVERMDEWEQIKLRVDEKVGPAWSLLRLVLPALGLPSAAPGTLADEYADFKKSIVPIF